VLELLLIVAAVLVLRYQLRRVGAAGSPAPDNRAETLAPSKATAQVARLAEYADRLFAEKKWLAAEKAYLNVLKVDHKNITAYSHLGIIYSTQKNLPDAMECFEIAARLRPSASTYQNLGLAYYENKNYMKAIATFEKSIMFEPSASRYVALARAHRKMSHITAVAEVLEQAVALDPVKKNLAQLAEAYEEASRKAEAEAVYRRIYELDPSDGQAARKIGIHLPGAGVAEA
jgi:tetratricopeptide (TPR) repeat protein